MNASIQYFKAGIIRLLCISSYISVSNKLLSAAVCLESLLQLNMGNSNQRQVGIQLPPDPRTYIQYDLPRFQVHSKLGNGKFMKSYHMRVDGTSLVVKVYVKSPDEDLQAIASRLSNMWRVLSPVRHPFLLPYQMWIKSNTKLPKSTCAPVYLIRQYFMSNLHERLSTRPFVTDIEKLFIVFQLLKALEVVHNYKIVHGDVKLENMMMTSWNWLILTDFASFKPTTLPDDDPTDFQYFFDSQINSRQRCSVAPERFYNKSKRVPKPKAASSGSTGPSDPAASGMFQDLDKEFERESIDTDADGSGQSVVVSPSMDVFSCGCAIAEIFLDGEPLLDLAAMVRYITSNEHLADYSLDYADANNVSGDSSVKAILNRISNLKVRRLVVEMTRRAPGRRQSVKDTLQALQQPDPATGEAGLFPAYFGSVLYPLFMKLQQGAGNIAGTVTADDRIILVCQHYELIIAEVTSRGVGSDPTGVLFFSSFASKEREAKKGASDEASTGMAGLKVEVGASAGPPSLDDLMTKCRDILQTLDSEDIYSGASLETAEGMDDAELPVKNNTADLVGTAAQMAQHGSHVSYFRESMAAGAVRVGEGADSEGLLMVIQVVCANIRHVHLPQTRIVALILLARLGSLCADSVVLQRVVPSVLQVLQDDQSCGVRAVAVRALTSLLHNVRQVAPFETQIFPNYIFPALSSLCKDPEVVVKVAFAECIGRIAEASKRMLEYTQLVVQNKAVSEAQKAATAEGQKPADASTDSDVPEAPASSSDAGGAGQPPSHITVPDGDYDAKLKVLQESIGRWIRDLIDTASNVSDTKPGGGERFDSGGRKGSGMSSHGSVIKRALLADIMRLCVFFGEVATIDLLLIQLLTFLNDQDWELREAFCAKIPCVCAYLGVTVTSDCILPCIENALVDVEEMVVVKAIKCITVLVELQLLRRAIMVECVENVAAILIHPSYSVREAAVGLIAATAAVYGRMDSMVFLLPHMKPCLKHDLVGVELTPCNVRHALVDPLSRAAYKEAVFARANLCGLNGDPPPAQEQESVPDPAEAAKLELMKRYIERAASELTSKTMQWRNSSNLGGGAGQSTLFDSNAARVSTLSTLGSSQTATASSASALRVQIEHSATQSLFVPNQKYGFYQGMAEEYRLLAFKHDQLKLSNIARIKFLYGVMLSKVEAERSLAVLGGLGEVSDGRGTVVQPASGEFGLGGAVVPSAATGSHAGGPIISDPVLLLQRIKSLQVPPISSELGNLHQPDGRKYNAYLEPLDTSMANDVSVNRASWRPRENVLVATLSEHSGAVNRLAVSPDQSYFISASNDKTARIWPTRGLDRSACPRSVCMYTGHNSKILDLVCVENSHGVVSASGDGKIHLWKVDMASQSSGPGGAGEDHSESNISAGGGSANFPGATARYAGGGHSSITGLSVVKTIDTEKQGGVNGLMHFNSDIASVITYSTPKGLFAWDVRSYKDAFAMPVRPELGYTTSMAMAPDRNWVCAGTSEGYVSLWDIRYNAQCKLWRHSSGGPIHRMASCKSIPKVNIGNIMSTAAGLTAAQTQQLQGSLPQQVYREIMPYTEGAYLFVAAGQNESAVYGIPEGGECLKCFRSVPMSSGRSRFMAELPKLVDIPLPRHPNGAITSVTGQARLNSSRNMNGNEPSVRAILGRISQTGSSYLVTAGTDRQIRFWDFSSPSRCFTVSGLELGQPKSAYESPNVENLHGRLYVSYDTALPSTSTLVQAHMPYWENRGPINPINKYKVLFVCHHLEFRNCILFIYCLCFYRMQLLTLRSLICQCGCFWLQEEMELSKYGGNFKQLRSLCMCNYFALRAPVIIYFEFIHPCVLWNL